MKTILPTIRRMSFSQSSLSPKFYSIKHHPAYSLATHHFTNSPRKLSNNFWPVLTSINHALQQQYATVGTASVNENSNDSQYTNIALAKRLVIHIYDQASIDNTASTKEAQDKIHLYRQLISHAKDLDCDIEQINELQEIINDCENGEPELIEMASQDLSLILSKFNQHLTDTAALLLPDHAFDAKSAVLEVQAGAGGNEASLFAEEIFNLYVGYSETNFEVDITSVEKHQGEGIDKATAIVNGMGAFRFLKYECGVHRVQRVPKATTGNKSDRLQTSTCSVAVLPVPDDRDQNIPEKELEIKFTRSGGPGGQNANKLDTACHVTHIPTGFTMKCQEFRTQHQNKAKALKQVQSMVYQQIYEKQMKQTNAFRKSQIGNMNRNEKIRTYNFTRNQVTDHRIDKGSRQVSDIAALLSGKLGYEVFHGLRDKIALEHQIKCLDEYLASF